MKASDVLLNGFDYSSKSFLQWELISKNSMIRSNITALIDSSSSPLNLTFPSNPEENDEIRIIDAKGSFNTNNVTIHSNKKIMQSDQNLTLNKQNSYITFVYINDTYGWKYDIINVNKIKGVELDKSNIDNNFILRYNAGSNTFTFEQVEPNTTAPILSGVSNASENTMITITITNYNAGTSYDVQVEAGGFNRTGASIYWDLPEVSSNQDYDLTVTATDPGQGPNATVHTVTVEDIPMSGDTAILVENNDFDDFIEEGQNYSNGSIIADKSEAWVMTKPEYQDGGDGDWAKFTPKIRVQTKEFDVKTGSTTSSLILDGDSDGIDDFLVKYSSNDLVTMDGNVASQSNEFLDPSFGSEQIFNSGSTVYISVVVLDSTHICVSYQDGGNSNYGTSIIGTISGSSISWGSEQVFNSGITYYISAVVLDSTHICVSYMDGGNSEYGTSIIGTISGSSISWGTEYVFNSSGSTYYISAVVLDSTHICVSYRDTGNSGYGTSIIGTISGNSISWGSESVFNSASISHMSVVVLDSTHICISYRDNGNSGYGTSIIGTISGTSISWSSKQVFNSGSTYNISAVKLDSTHICVSYSDTGNSYYGTSIIGTISGNSISWGTEQVFNAGNTNDISAVLIDSTHICVSYKDNGNSDYGTSIIGTISGSSISWGTESVFNTASISYISTVVLDSTHICVSYSDAGNSDYGTSIIGEVGLESTLTLTTPLSAVPEKLFIKSNSDFHTAIASENEYIPSKDIQLTDLSNITTTGLTGKSDKSDLWSSDGYFDKVLLKVGTDYVETDVTGLTVSASDSEFGDEQVFNSGSTYNISAILLDSTHICVSYNDGGNSYYGTSIIGTISGNSISWGTESVFNSGNTNHISAVALDSTHICVSYSDNGNSNYGTSIIGTISGSSISWGTEQVFNSASTQSISAVVIDSTHICVSYQDSGNSYYGTSIIGTISGSSISWGSESVFNSGLTIEISAVKLDSTHICVSYQDYGNSNYGTSIIGTISGSSISWGTEQVFNSESTQSISAVVIDSTHICVSYKDSGNSYYGTSIIGTISGNSISWGSESVFNSASIDYISAVALDSTHICVSYMDGDNSSYGTSIIGTISGSIISWGSESVFNSSGSTNFISAVVLDSTHICVSYNDGGNSTYGTSIIESFESEYELTFVAQASAPTEAWKPTPFTQDITLPLDSATTTTVVTTRTEDFWNEPKIGADTLDLLVGGNTVTTNITDINKVGTGYTGYIENGDEQVFNSGITSYISLVLLDSTHICVSYNDGGNSYYGTSIIGTISGNSISWGTESVFNSSGWTYYISAVLIDSTHICVSYSDYGNSAYGTSIIGTISGTSISWGTEQVFNAGNTSNISAVALDSTHICVSYQDVGNSNYGTSIIGTISGNSISWGSEQVFNSASIDYISAVLLDSTHICVSYKDSGNSYYGTSIIGTISGNSISWGTASVFNAANTSYISAVLLDSTHICVSYKDSGNSYYGTSIIGTISGNSISWGTASVFNAADTYFISAVVLDSTHICVSYQDEGNSEYGTSIIQTLSQEQEYTFTFASQMSAPTEAKLTSTSLTPTNKTFISASDSIEAQYNEIDFQSENGIRQLKFFVDFENINDKWIYLYSELNTKP